MIVRFPGGLPPSGPPADDGWLSDSPGGCRPPDTPQSVSVSGLVGGLVGALVGGLVGALSVGLSVGLSMGVGEHHQDHHSEGRHRAQYPCGSGI